MRAEGSGEEGVSWARHEARRLRAELGLTGRLNIQAVVGHQGLHVIAWDLPKEIQEIKYRSWIGITRRATEPWRRFLTAHAIGHHLLHTGNQLALRRLFIGGDAKIERQADEFAWHLLVDEWELAELDAQGADLNVVPERFGVPTEIAFRFLLSR